MVQLVLTLLRDWVIVVRYALNLVILEYVSSIKSAQLKKKSKMKYGTKPVYNDLLITLCNLGLVSYSTKGQVMFCINLEFTRIIERELEEERKRRND